MTAGNFMGQEEENKENNEEADKEKRTIEIDVQDESHLLDKKQDKKT